MRADLLHVVTVVSNPYQSKIRWQLAREFVQHMVDCGVDLTLVEVQQGERPFEFTGIPGVGHYIPTRASTVAWVKESAANVGFRNLPSDAKYVGWFDADVEFRDKDFAAKAVHQLQISPVLQPWSAANDLGPTGEVLEQHTSFGKIWRQGGNVVDWWKQREAGDPYCYPHPGLAWCARMDFLENCGLLLDCSGLGAADHQMALGMVGYGAEAIHSLSTQSYKNSVQAWCDRAFAESAGHVDYIEGRIEHKFHGDKASRKYVGRWDILNEYAFDPVTDLHRNRYGILELSNNKPAMRRAFEKYFRDRAENDGA